MAWAGTYEIRMTNGDRYYVGGAAAMEIVGLSGGARDYGKMERYEMLAAPVGYPQPFATGLVWIAYPAVVSVHRVD
jgi:hypothetical protein